MDSQGKGEVILVVDDNTAVRSAVQEMLERSGYTVYTAADGRQGLSCFESNRSRFELLLTDITMPSMDGIELARRVAQCGSRLPVLFMTGGTDNPSMGCGVLRKPFTQDELLDSVRGVLNRGPASTSLAQ